MPDRYALHSITVTLKGGTRRPIAHTVWHKSTKFGVVIVTGERRVSRTRVVSSQLVKYLKENDLLPDLQSAYRAMHSTETAVLKVLADLLLSLDSGDLAIVTLLNLSSAFDSVDHATLLQRLQRSYGLGGQVLKWFASYLCGRVHYVRTSTPYVLRHQTFCMEYRKDRSSDRSYFFYTPPTCCS